MVLIPDEDELRKYLLFTLAHSCHVEYFLARFDFYNFSDLERPHDIVGAGNKFEWRVMKGLALAYRTDIKNKRTSKSIQNHILQSRDIHRQQYHHKIWMNVTVPASNSDMVLSAIDVICSQLENRPYQGGKHTYDELLKTIAADSRQISYIMHIIENMQDFSQPNLEAIVSLSSFPNIGIPEKMYDIAVQRVAETLEMLKDRGYKIK